MAKLTGILMDPSSHSGRLDLVPLPKSGWPIITLYPGLRSYRYFGVYDYEGDLKTEIHQFSRQIQVELEE